MELKVYNTETTLFRKNEALVKPNGEIAGHAYVILYGKVNFYNEHRINYINPNAVQAKVQQFILKKFVQIAAQNNQSKNAKNDQGPREGFSIDVRQEYM